MNQLADKVEPFPGVVDVIRQIGSEGIKLATVSSALNEYVHHFLDRTKLADVMDDVLTEANVIYKHLALLRALWKLESKP
jgi:beta-phosphoglucomutase-like phosphatase (HAD superfamily)